MTSVAKDAIGQDIHVRRVISGSIQISTIMVDGRDARLIESFESDSKEAGRSSSVGNIELMGHA